MDEKRTSVRRRMLKAGTIEFGGGAIGCTARNLSQAGAALDVESQLGIPDEFVLVVPIDRLRRRCRVVWRKAKRIGITVG